MVGLAVGVLDEALGVAGHDRSVEVPSLGVLLTGPRRPRGRAEAVRIVDQPVQRGDLLGVVELGTGLLELLLVDLEVRVERGVELHLLEELGIEPRRLVGGVVALIEGFGSTHGHSGVSYPEGFREDRRMPATPRW